MYYSEREGYEGRERDNIQREEGGREMKGEKGVIFRGREGGEGRERGNIKREGGR